MSMENNVRLLDATTANQIAAGEVVEKPASVVKELVENSLDAGADNIEVTVFAGGTEYIRVTDNGSGMTEENAKMSVLRHATSKISNAADLMDLHTLGFRGEALPSIASVSNFRLLTRPEGSDFATSVAIDGGKDAECAETGGNVGTTVIVENLFFNVPARRKFLKTPATEGRYISELLTKLSLSRPDAHFRLINGDKEVLSTPGSGDLLETIRAIYGRDVAENLLNVDFEGNDGIKIKGVIGRPTLLKGTRQWQTLFVNGRMITSRMLAKAIDHAYQSQIPKSGFPFAVLNIGVDTASIDVNVHPQKSEIKFSNDSAVYRAVYKALTDALTSPMGAKKECEGDAHSFYVMEQHPGAPCVHPSGDRAVQQGMWDAGSSAFDITAVREEMAGTEPFRETIEIRDTDSGVDTIWPIGQVDKTFIIAQSEDAVYLIDQHAAHERIIYDRLVKLHNEIPSQQLLVPVFLDMRPQEIAIIEEYREGFVRLGVEAAAAGDEMLRVSSLPLDVSEEDAGDFISEICTMLGELREITHSDLRQAVLHMTACKAAIKAGQLLNMRQMRQIIIELLNTEHPFTCPHGRPCIIEINSDQLYKMFKRTGF